MNEVLNCDRPGCSHVERVEHITEDMVGMSCPVCGSNLLTQEDYDGWLAIRDLIKAVDAAIPEGGGGDPVDLRIGAHNGKVTVSITSRDPED